LYKEPISLDTALFKQEEQDHGIATVLDRKLIQLATPYLEKGKSVHGAFAITNEDRAVGTMLSNEIAKKFPHGRPDNESIHVKFQGTAGQSFAAFAAKGLTFELEGDSNDYFGKGLSGASLIVYPDKRTKYSPSQNMIIGNVALFGATSGEVFVRGKAGERFAVRNSGAQAVVEGVGDHGCEYMTGGTVVVLGETGRNFAAGMSGGVVYVWDQKGHFKQNVNREMVIFDEISEQDEQQLHTLVERHYQLTGSEVAEEIVAHWQQSRAQFIKVMPVEYKAVLEKRKKELVSH
ncbi:MAG: glutamate synthase subunit alpha, partial [Cyclobacteriaceae bacterium]|nr:glutamate synthase subunit alpha [Cyclobacteriaceae bacterium]